MELSRIGTRLSQALGVTGALIVLLSLASAASVTVLGSRNVLAFISYRDGNRRVYLYDIDRAYTHVLSRDRNTRDSYPAWSPDGRQIVFVSNRSGNAQLYLMNASGRGLRRLSERESDDFLPSWLPDGQQIAFASNRGGDYELYVIDADGTNSRNISQNPGADDLYPVWSPDGRRIAFASNREGNFELYVMDADCVDTPTGCQDSARRLTHTGDLFEDFYPTWSPDSTQIAFVSFRDRNYEIYVIDADGSNLRRLTNDPARDEAPAWSPDGTQIAFMSSRDGDFEIYLMDTDGGSLRKLTDNTAGDYTPVWQPLYNAK